MSGIYLPVRNIQGSEADRIRKSKRLIFNKSEKYKKKRKKWKDGGA